MTSNIQEDKLKEFFRPEFLNRIDDVVTFHSLSEDNLLEITDILLEGIRKNLSEKEIEVTFDESLKKYLIKV
jgi:ATP-dependent Clp protease ATP-binding subunit ClpA